MIEKFDVERVKAVEMAMLKGEQVEKYYRN